jgi:hypothetical protein
MVETRHNLILEGAESQLRDGESVKDGEQSKPVSVLPISPIGYSVSINTQYRVTASPNQKGLSRNDIGQNQNIRKKKRWPLVMQRSQNEGEDQLGDGMFLASLGRDSGKELYERQQAKIMRENSFRAAETARQLAKRKTSGFNNELIQYAEKQEALGLSARAKNLNETSGHMGSVIGRGPLAFMSSGGGLIGQEPDTEGSKDRS